MGSCFSGPSAPTPAKQEPQEKVATKAKEPTKKAQLYAETKAHKLPPSDTPKPTSAGAAAAEAAERRRQEYEEKMRPKRRL